MQKPPLKPNTVQLKTTAVPNRLGNGTAAQQKPQNNAVQLKTTAVPNRLANSAAAQQKPQNNAVQLKTTAVPNRLGNGTAAQLKTTAVPNRLANGTAAQQKPQPPAVQLKTTAVPNRLANGAAAQQKPQNNAVQLKTTAVPNRLNNTVIVSHTPQHNALQQKSSAVPHSVGQNSATQPNSSTNIESVQQNTVLQTMLGRAWKMALNARSLVMTEARALPALLSNNIYWRQGPQNPRFFDNISQLPPIPRQRAQGPQPDDVFMERFFPFGNPGRLQEVASYEQLPPGTIIFRADTRTKAEIEAANGFSIFEARFTGQLQSPENLRDYQRNNRNPGVISFSSTREGAESIAEMNRNIKYNLFAVQGDGLLYFPRESSRATDRTFERQQEIMVYAPNGIPIDKITFLGEIKVDTSSARPPIFDP